MTQRAIASALLPIARQARTKRVSSSVSEDAAYVFGKTSNPDRLAYGYTGRNVFCGNKSKACSVGDLSPACAVCVLRARGIQCPIEEAEGHLISALCLLDGMRIETPDVSRDRVKRFRRKAHANGQCVVCGREPKRDGKKTCAQCNFTAACRVARSREARKARADKVAA